MAFTPGWNPQMQQAARERFAAASGVMVMLSLLLTPLNRAKSLSKYRLRVLKQGQAGTCWVHAAVALVEFWAKARGLDAFAVCRRAVGYFGKRLEGGGNPTSGGDPLDALRVMTDEESGSSVGIAHESLFPYSDNSRDLATRPPQTVLDDGKKCHVVTPIKVRDLDEVKTLIDHDTPTAVAIWWPYAWDHLGATFINWIGQGQYGHALLIIGYIPKGCVDEFDWFEIENWHDEIYGVLPQETAAKFDGYTISSPGKNTAFLVRRDVLETVMGYGNSELLSATDLEGLISLCDPVDAASPGLVYGS